MSRRMFRSTAFALALGFFALQAAAVPLSEDRGRESERQVKRLPHVLVAAWERVTSFLVKNGSIIDPFGKPAPGEGDGTAPQDGGENGSVIDPFG
jgi:hypothetical protein